MYAGFSNCEYQSAEITLHTDNNYELLTASKHCGLKLLFKLDGWGAKK